MQANNEKYLYGHEGRAVRFIKGTTPYSGLCTANFSICAIFCFKSQDGRRLSLVHVNRFTTSAQVLQEAQWIGKEGRCTVYTRGVPTLNLRTQQLAVLGLDLLKDTHLSNACNFKVEQINGDYNSLSLNSDGHVQLLTNTIESTKAIYHPLAAQIDYCAKLNEHLATYSAIFDLKQQFLLFDGANWLQLQSHDLTLHPKARAGVKSMKVSSEDSVWTIRNALRQYFALVLVRDVPGLENTNDIQKVAHKVPMWLQEVIDNPTPDMTGISIMVSNMLQLYMLNNNAVEYFKINVRYELVNAAQPKSAADKQVAAKIKEALRGENPVATICELLRPLDRKTPFRDDMVGLVLGTNGYFDYYQNSTRSQWHDLSLAVENIDATDSLEFALRHAAGKGNLAQLKQLAGVVHNINACGKSGKTALHNAAIRDRVDMVEFLLEHNADRELTDEEKKKPIDYASENCKAIFDKHPVTPTTTFN